MLSWDRHIVRVQSFLTEVVQLDLTKYYAVLLTNTIEFRQDFDGIAEETLRYNLISNDSDLDVDFRFRNQTLFRYGMNVIEGSPIFLNTKPVELSDYFSEILLNYRTYSGFSYFEQLKEMLNEANDLGAIETTRDNMKLVLSTEIDETEVRLFHTRAGINYQAKGVLFRFEDGILEEFTNGYNLYRIATTEINISEEEAKTLAEEHAKTVSWTDDGQKVSNFNILYELTEAELYPHPRETLDLVPYWFVTIKLDHIYPGNVNFIGIGYGQTQEKSTDINY